MHVGSSLLDLKAELSRKEDELSKTKQTSATGKRSNKTFEKLQQMTNKKKKKRKEKEGQQATQYDTPTRTSQHEYEETLERSRQMLTAKTKIYDKMQKGEMEDVEDYKGDTRYLVDFHQKAYASETPYRDQIGKRNLEVIDRIDDGSTKDSDKNSRSETVSSSSRLTEAAARIFEANEEHTEMLQEKWRREQEEILNGPVHYQNVRFDEVRELGTGYYAFSRDDEQRQKEMEELREMRQNTINVQKKKDQLQQKRKQALQERLLKVKIRKAKEQGIPIDDLLKGDAVSDNGKDQTPETVACLKPNNITSELAFTEDEQKSLTGGNVESRPNQGNELNLESKASIDFCTQSFVEECRRAAITHPKTTSSETTTTTTTTKEREWDRGKNKQFIQQPFVKPKHQQQTNSYERMLEEKRGERTEEFAPPKFY